MDFWLGWLAAALSLYRNNVLPCSFPRTGGGLLLTGHDVEIQTGHSGFVARNQESLAYLFTGTGEMSAHPYVTPGPHFIVHQSGARKKLLKRIFHMVEVETTRTSILMGLSYMQHAGSEGRRRLCSSYNSYFATENHVLTDAIACAYENITALGSRKTAVYFKRDWVCRRQMVMEMQ